jgi:hypothetical protein
MRWPGKAAAFQAAKHSNGVSQPSGLRKKIDAENLQ